MLRAGTQRHGCKFRDHERPYGQPEIRGRLRAVRQDRVLRQLGAGVSQQRSARHHDRGRSERQDHAAAARPAARPLARRRDRGAHARHRRSEQHAVGVRARFRFGAALRRRCRHRRGEPDQPPGRGRVGERLPGHVVAQPRSRGCLYARALHQRRSGGQAHPGSGRGGDRRRLRRRQPGPLVRRHAAALFRPAALDRGQQRALELHGACLRPCRLQARRNVARASRRLQSAQRQEKPDRLFLRLAPARRAGRGRQRRPLPSGRALDSASIAEHGLLTMTDITAFNSDYVTTRRAPLDPTTRRSRRFGLAVAIGLHAAVIALLMTVRPWAPAAPEQLRYDLVFVEPAPAPPPPPPAPPDANLPETPAGPPELVTEPEPAPMVTSVPELPKPAPPPHPPVRHPTPAPAPRAPQAPPAAAPTQTDSSASSPMAPPTPSPPAVPAPPPPDLPQTPTPRPHLYQHQEYPWMARRRGVQGRVILRLAVARSGNVTEARIETSSGAELLDQAAVDMVHRANPLPPLPASFVGDRAEFRVPVEFALSRQ